MYTSKRKDLGKHDSSQIFEGLLCRRKVRFVLCNYVLGRTRTRGEKGGSFMEACACLSLGRTFQQLECFKINGLPCWHYYRENSRRLTQKINPDEH